MTAKPREIKIVDDNAEEVGCDGNSGALGHPLVYLQFEGRKSVDCYYCGQRFAHSDYKSSDANAG
ncbi:MAG: zinc-finger domain-containing protein [Gammaproteobacteria bacterium]